MRAVICAAGLGSRWNNYLGTRKHMAPIEGEPLLHRTVRLLREHGVTDIRLTYHPDHPYDIPGVKCFERHTKEATTARKLTWSEWCMTDEHEGRTLLMLGDVYYTDATIKTMTTPIEGWHQYGRLSVSKATGKPGAEMFGWQFHTRDHHEFIAAIEAVDAARDAGQKTHVDWSLYSYMTGHPIDTPPDNIRDWGRHVEIPDDGTDDFDFPDDYERWMFYMRNRSARRVIASDFKELWFTERMRELGLHHKMHRKAWEFSAITQAYSDRIGRGGRCLGFGVGREPVPAWLAAHGAQVVATDRPEAGVWLDRQHAKGKAELRWEGICTPEEYAGIEFAPCDMNAIDPAYHGQFDFTWSASCFEHLGGIEAGLKFFENQLACLKPGGIAVHTTEYNSASNDATVNSSNLCFFRQKDLLELTHRLHKKGDRLWPINLVPGRDPQDGIIDVPPFDGPVHLNLELGGHRFTSVLLIGMKG